MSENVPMPCKLLIVCTNVWETAGIRMAMGDQPHVAIVGEAKTPHAAIEAIKRDLPTTLLVDVDDLGGQTLSLLRDVRAFDKTLNVVLLSALENGELVKSAMDLGATAVVLKVQPIQVLIRQLQLSAPTSESVRKTTRLPQRLSVVTVPEDDFATVRIQTLTDREHEIIDYIGKGLTNKEIASRLEISFITVRHHLSRIFSKLGTENRQKLLLFAHAHELVNRTGVSRGVARHLAGQ